MWTRCGPYNIQHGLNSAVRKKAPPPPDTLFLFEWKNTPTNLVWTKHFTATYWKIVKINIQIHKDDVNGIPLG